MHVEHILWAQTCWTNTFETFWAQNLIGPKFGEAQNLKIAITRKPSIRLYPLGKQLLVNVNVVGISIMILCDEIQKKNHFNIPLSKVP